MEGGPVSEKQTSSYTYWVRETTSDAAPLPVPKMLSAQDVSSQSSHAPTLGSVWNKAGTWEEKNLNKWATERIKELLGSIGSLEFTNGKAEVDEVSKCSGDAYLVTVRNKKRVGYTYELTVNVKGEWLVGGENKKVKGYLEIPEFSYGELDDLEICSPEKTRTKLSLWLSPITWTLEVPQEICLNKAIFSTFSESMD